jgi:hypothetical protein
VTSEATGAYVPFYDSTVLDLVVTRGSYILYYRGITGRQEVGFPPRCVWCHHATSTSPRALPRLPARALPGRFRPQYFLTRTGVT